MDKWICVKCGEASDYKLGSDYYCARHWCEVNNLPIRKSMPGIGGRRKLSKENLLLSAVIKIQQGEGYVKKKKRVVKRTKIKNDMFEKKLEKDILIYLNTFEHINAWKNGESSIYNPKYIWDGMADIGGFNYKTKKPFFIEVKYGKNKQRATQIMFESMCKRMDIPYVLAYNKEDVKVVL